jgi:hypothetical protein
MSFITIMYLIGGSAGLIFILIIIAKLKRSKKDRTENKTLKRYQKKVSKTEAQKTKIRDKHNEKVNNIIANPNGNSLSNGERKHNHAFREPCGKDCPAYTGE